MPPEPLYSVARPDASSETQNGVLPPNEIPHGFFRFGSVVGARPGMSKAVAAVTVAKIYPS